MAKKQRRKVSAKAFKNEKRGFDSACFTIPEGMNIMKLKNPGNKKLEIIPYEVGERFPIVGFEPGDMHWELRFWMHRNVGADQKSVVCPAQTTGSKCPICEHRARLQTDSEADPKLIAALKPKERQLILVVDHADMEKGVQLYETSYYNFGKALKTALDDDEGDEEGYQFFADQEEGFTLRCTVTEEKTGENNYNAITRIAFQPRKVELDGDFYGHEICLQDLLIIPEYEELKKRFLQIEDDDDSEGEPKAGGKKIRAKKKKEEPEEEESEDPEEEEPKPAAKKKSKKKSAKKGNPKQSKFKVGRRVKAPVDGEDYEGEISSCPPGGDQVQVTFDDGDVLMVDCGDIEFLDEPEEETEGEPEPAGKKKGTKKAKAEDEEDWDEGDWE